ncbi:MAG: Lrp/AsnC family transcriptional regulator [Phycisphaerae bacterium]|nr:Lrp/AsnC family transcriptional regulator [Phycisphaerae bacterium]
MGLLLSDIEKKVLAVIQDGFPNSPQPYKDMAKKAGIEVDQLLDMLKKWHQEGILRRIGAVVNHFKAGADVGAMVAWQVERERVEEAGKILASFKEVSHAYERQTSKSWPYNLYSMVHGKSVENVTWAIRRMSKACRISEYRVLFTEKELKKSSPVYISPEENVI